MKNKSKKSNMFGIVILVLVLILSISMIFVFTGSSDQSVSSEGKAGADGKDGVGITSISLTNSEGLVDTYTITYTDGSTSTFIITNGADGKDGLNGKDGKDGENFILTEPLTQVMTSDIIPLSGIAESFFVDFSQSELTSLTMLQQDIIERIDTISSISIMIATESGMVFKFPLSFFIDTSDLSLKFTGVLPVITAYGNSEFVICFFDCGSNRMYFVSANIEYAEDLAGLFSSCLLQFFIVYS